LRKFSQSFQDNTQKQVKASSAVVIKLKFNVGTATNASYYLVSNELGSSRIVFYNTKQVLPVE
jgi:hypothetical protein